MRTLLIAIVVVSIISVTACDKNSEGNNQIVDCENRPEWNHFDPECGCYGPSIGFSGGCILATGGEITYFALTSFHHIQDSLCFMYIPSADEINIINVNNKSFGGISLGITVAEAKARNKNMLYEFFHQDVKDPSDALKQSKSYIKVDPKKFDSSLDVLRLKAYQKQIGLFGNAILDSTEIVFVKQLNRR
jgi:hypothetical protein